MVLDVPRNEGPSLGTKYERNEKYYENCKELSSKGFFAIIFGFWRAQLPAICSVSRFFSANKKGLT